MDGRSLKRLRSELEEFVGELLSDLPRRDQRRWAQTYLRGLLLDGHRKSIEPMAKRLEEIDGSKHDYEQSLQQLVNQSPWPAGLVRDRLQRWVAARSAAQARRHRDRSGAEVQRLLIIDETGFPKQGKGSVGVSRQYSGTLGKVASCQMAVTLQYATQPAGKVQGGEVFCVDVRLFLPEKTWGNDRKRMTGAGVPPDVGYEPKWKMALTMLNLAKANGLNGVVLADALYGSVTEFRRSLDREGWTYCVGVESTLSVIDAAQDLGEVPPWSGYGRPPTRPSRVAAKIAGVSVRRWAMGRAADFRTVNWREGSRVRKGKARQLSGRFAAWRVCPAHRLSDGRRPQRECWLLAEWPSGEDAPTKFFLANLPARASLRQLVRTAKGRWWVEQSYREMKEELGLDHYEGRSWVGWHHHVVLVMLAYAFVVAYRRQKRGDTTGPPSAYRRPAA
jgi:SRSO17 transposase